MKKVSLVLVVLFFGLALSVQAQTTALDYHPGSWAVAFWSYDLKDYGTILASGRANVDDLSGKAMTANFPSLSAFFADQEGKGWVVDSITPLFAGQTAHPSLGITFKRKAG